MSERKTRKNGPPGGAALFRNRLLDEHPSPAKNALWTGRLPEAAHDASDDALLPSPASLPSREQLEDRAGRVRRKLASWDRDKLETYYVRTLLSALLLRKSQRLLGEVLPFLDAISKQQASHRELRKTARILALYANMLFKLELPRRKGSGKGGNKAARRKKAEAQSRHDQWLAAHDRLIASGTEPRYIAGKLAPEYEVLPRAMREGIKEAKQRAKNKDSQ